MMNGTPQMVEIPGYQAVQFLGTGARSTIWQVRDRQTNQYFALKRVVKQHLADYRFLEQAINEYEVASRLDHPVIRKIYRLRKVKEWLRLREVQLIMELCDGTTVQAARPTSIPRIMDIFHEVAMALAYMNSKGFVHADMKPNNILVSSHGKVKIIDLGQSCPLGTTKLRIQGTPDFIAPEQVYRRPLDARTDVFNFAAALYWTLTGQAIPTVLPKKGGMQIMIDQAIIPPHEVNPEVPLPLSRLVTECTRTNPLQRPASMNDVVSRLDLIAHTMKNAS
jgi:serine/threonine-protein kinase